MGLKEKVIDWKNRLKDRHMLTIIVTLIAIIAILAMVIYKKQTEYRQASENSYNQAFYELVDYVQNVENYLGKSLISTTPEHGAETLTRVWKEANLAQTYLCSFLIVSNYNHLPDLKILMCFLVRYYLLVIVINKFELNLLLSKL